MQKTDCKAQQKITVCASDLLGREVIVFSSGRSGSNRILDITDLASEAHCRNEPNEYCQSFTPMRNQNFTAIQGNADALVQSMTTAMRCYGARDRFSTNPKRFLRPFLGSAYRRTCAHSFWRERLLRVKEPEWKIPQKLFQDDWKDVIIPVFKISGTLQTARQVAASPPDVKIIHNLRKPSTMLQSWWNRYGIELRGGDLDFLETEINSHLKEWGGEKYNLFENKGMTKLEKVVRANLFAWRLANESVYESYKDSNSYLLTDYDEVSRDQNSKAEEILAFIGAKREINRSAKPAVENKLFQSTHKQSLPSDLLSSAIKDVLTGSPLEHLVNE